jgi:hypothetical protein
VYDATTPKAENNNDKNAIAKRGQHTGTPTSRTDRCADRAEVDPDCGITLSSDLQTMVAEEADQLRNYATTMTRT